MVFGFVAELYLWLDTKVPWTWYVAIGTVITFVVGYAVSLAAEGKAFNRKGRKVSAKVAKKTNRPFCILSPYILSFHHGPSYRACTRSSAQSCQRDCRGHHHWQRNFSGSGRDDAGGWVGQAGLSGMAGGRAALFFWGADLRRTGRHEAAGRRRVCLHPRRLRTAGWFSLCLDLVRHRQARVDCHAGYRFRARAGKFSGLQFLLP